MRTSALRLLFFAGAAVCPGCDSDAPCDTAGPATPCHAPDPGAPGPFAVGVTTITLTDTDREEPGGGPRVLTVDVWYPATDAAHTAERDVYTFEREAPADVLAQLGGIDVALPAQDAARDAEPERAGAPYPLLTFSHGKNGVRFQTAGLLVHLASHGYVVAAPDHPRDTIWELLRGEDPGANLLDHLIERPNDLSFVATSIAAADSPFAGLADLERWGVLGHSIGGTTSILIAADRGGFDDDRVKAFVPITPAAAIAGYVGAGTEYKASPMWVVAALDDQTLDYATEQEIAYTEGRSGKGMATLNRAGHFSFTHFCALDLASLGAAFSVDLSRVANDGCTADFASSTDILSITAFFTTAFFNHVLRDSPPAASQLATEALPESWRELVEVAKEGL